MPGLTLAVKEVTVTATVLPAANVGIFCLVSQA